MNKNIVRKLKLMLRPTRKKVIVAVAVVAVAGVGLYVNSRVRRAQQALAGAVQQATYRTVTLERASLSDSVTVTGTVESGDVANVTTQLTATVDEILVQVGDTVQEGDVICTLDSSDLEDQLAKLREQQSDTGESAQRSVEQAEKSLATAQENLTDAYNTYASAASALETARAAWRPAYESIKAYQTAYDNALAAQAAAGAALNGDAQLLAAQVAQQSAQTSVTSAQQQVDTAKKALEEAQKNGGDTAAAASALDAANAQLAAAQSQLDAANAQYETALAGAQSLADAYAKATAACETAKAQLDTAKANCNYEALYGAYSSADQACIQAETAYKQAQSQADSAQNQLDSAKEQLDSDAIADQIEELEEQIADCTIRATASGTITSLNATVGSMASSSTGTALATIQDTNALKVAVTIDENDIKKVAVGQSAVIRSDATGDAEIAGTLTQLSVTSSGAQAMGQSTAGFSAEVTVNSPDSGLLIGLSAQVEIILSEEEGVFSVPYDAVETDEDGRSVVYARSGEGEDWQAVPVATGMETDYYVAISGEGLAEGMQVRVPIGEGETTDVLTQMMESMQSGGMPGGGGGDMPGGDFGGGMPAGGPQG